MSAKPTEQGEEVAAPPAPEEAPATADVTATDSGTRPIDDPTAVPIDLLGGEGRPAVRRVAPVAGAVLVVVLLRRLRRARRAR